MDFDSQEFYMGFTGYLRTSQISITGFGFSEKYELLEGDWIFEIISGNHVAKQVFHIIKRNQE